MKKLLRAVVIACIISGALLIPVCTKAQAAKKVEYVYYDLDNWKRYLSTEVPNCSHRNIAYRYVEDDFHSKFCLDCGVIFGYEKCYIDNYTYSSPSDYYHDRCLRCLNKKEYVYTPTVKDKSGRTYID